MALTTVLFYVTALLAILAAVRVVTAQYIFRSALWLAVCLASLAVQFLLLHAEFVAVVQIMVYVGAVIILLIFAVMLTAQMGDVNVSQTNRLGIPAAIGAALIGWKLYEVLGATKFVGAEAASASAGAGAGAAAIAQEGNLVAIGKQLLGTGSAYVYPFELIACILFTALVGAVLIARKDPE